MSALTKYSWGDPWEPRAKRSASAVRAAAAPLCGAGCQGGLYTVVAGDSMFNIARKLGVSLDALIACNPQVPDPSRIQVGQQLCTPGGVPPICGAGCQGGLYTVVAGDSMFTIARKLGVSLDALIACNPQIPDPNRIQVGQQLCTPGAVPPTGLPCCVVLNRVVSLPGSDAAGVALVRGLVGISPGTTGVTFAAEALSNPADLGDFDSYAGVVSTSTNTFRTTLTPTSETPPTWSGSIVGITAALPPSTTLQVRPLNTMTQTLGAAVLTGTLAHCISGGA